MSLERAASNAAMQPISYEINRFDPSSDGKSASLEITVGDETFDVEISGFSEGSPISEIVGKIKDLVAALASQQSDADVATYEFPHTATNLSDVKKKGDDGQFRGLNKTDAIFNKTFQLSERSEVKESAFAPRSTAESYHNHRQSQVNAGFSSGGPLNMGHHTHVDGHSRTSGTHVSGNNSPQAPTQDFSTILDKYLDKACENYLNKCEESNTPTPPLQTLRKQSAEQLKQRFSDQYIGNRSKSVIKSGLKGWSPMNRFKTSVTDKAKNEYTSTVRNAYKKKLEQTKKALLSKNKNLSNVDKTKYPNLSTFLKKGKAPPEKLGDIKQEIATLLSGLERDCPNAKENSPATYEADIKPLKDALGMFETVIVLEETITGEAGNQIGETFTQSLTEAKTKQTNEEELEQFGKWAESNIGNEEYGFATTSANGRKEVTDEVLEFIENRQADRPPKRPLPENYAKLLNAFDNFRQGTDSVQPQKLTERQQELTTQSQSIQVQINAGEEKIAEEKAKPTPDRAKINTLRESIGALKDDLETANEELESLSSSKRGSKPSKENLEAKKRTLMTASESLQVNITGAETKIAAKKAETSPNLAKIATLQSALEGLQEDLSEITGKLRNVDAKLESLTASAPENKAPVIPPSNTEPTQTPTEQLASKKAELGSLRRKNKELKKKIGCLGKLPGRLKTTKAKKAKVEQKIETVKGQIKALQKEVLYGTPESKNEAEFLEEFGETMKFIDAASEGAYNPTSALGAVDTLREKALDIIRNKSSAEVFSSREYKTIMTTLNSAASTTFHSQDTWETEGIPDPPNKQLHHKCLTSYNQIRSALKSKIEADKPSDKEALSADLNFVRQASKGVYSPTSAIDTVTDLKEKALDALQTGDKDTYKSIFNNLLRANGRARSSSTDGNISREKAAAMGELHKACDSALNEIRAAKNPPQNTAATDGEQKTGDIQQATVIDTAKARNVSKNLPKNTTSILKALENPKKLGKLNALDIGNALNSLLGPSDVDSDKKNAAVSKLAGAFADKLRAEYLPADEEGTYEDATIKLAQGLIKKLEGRESKGGIKKLNEVMDAISEGGLFEEVDDEN